MKFTYKNIKTCLSVALIAGALFSCSEDKMDRINQDRDNAHDVDAKFILTDVITSTAFSNVGGDLIIIFVLHRAGSRNLQSTLEC